MAIHLTSSIWEEIMEHIDFAQEQVRLESGELLWVTFCECGKAFWGYSSERAYSEWERHESRES